MFILMQAAAETQAVTLVQAIIGGIGAGTISLTLIRLMIWKGNKETKDEFKAFEKSNTEEHLKLFKELKEQGTTINRYTSNEAFYKALEKLAQDGVSIVQEEPEENSPSNPNPNLTSNGELDLGCLIQVILESIKEFAKDILLIGIVDVSDESVVSKINAVKAKIRAKSDRVMGVVGAKEFRKKCNPIFTAYAKDVKNVSIDVCNNKNGSFKNITLVFTRKMISQVIKFGWLLVERN